MFGRYELPAWRRGLGLILVIVFVWGFYGYMTANHWPHDNGSNTEYAQDGGTIPGDKSLDAVSDESGQ